MLNLILSGLIIAAAAFVFGYIFSGRKRAASGAMGEQSSDEILRSVVNNIPQLVYWKNTDSVFAGCNKAFARAAGFDSPEDVIGLSDYDLPSSEAEKSLYIECDRRVMSNNEPELNILETQHKSDGTILQLNTSKVPLHDKSGRVIGVLGTTDDITDSFRMAEMLRQIIDNIPQRVFWKDLNSVYIGCNQSFAEGAGLQSYVDIVGKTDFDLPWSRAEAEWYRECDKRVMDLDKAELHISETQEMADGKLTYIDTNKIALHDANGNVNGILGTFEDVTERKNIQELLIHNEKMRSVAGLAAGTAHEINNPLAGLIQTVEILQSRLSAGAELPANVETAERTGLSMDVLNEYLRQREIPQMLSIVLDSGDRIAEIVDNMLCFARKTDSSKSNYCLNNLFEKTLELAMTDTELKKEYSFNDVSINRQLDDKLPSVPCDRPMIQQVLLNIIKNSAEAMYYGKTPNPAIDIRSYTNETETMACLEISNSGPAIDEDVQKRIFEPFFTTKPAGAGTGLGLSVSYFIIAENHGGEMEVESTDSGVKFIIRLPLYAVAQP